MEYIKAWAASLIALMLITAILKFLTPSGNIKKTANAVISVIVLIILLSPLGKIGKTEFEIPDLNIDFESVQNENTVYGNAVRKAVEDALSERKIEFENVTVNSRFNDGYIEIESVEVKLNDIRNYDAAVLAIVEKTGIERGAITVYD